MPGHKLSLNLNGYALDQVERPYSCHLTEDGAGVDDNANGDYSSATAYWELRPSSTQVIAIYRMMVYILDSGTVSTSTYGAIVGGVTNGITISVVRGTGAAAALRYLVHGEAINNNGEWKQIMYDLDIDGAGLGLVTGRWTFFEHGVPIILDGSKDDALRLTLSDNFSGLLVHHFTAQGACVDSVVA